MNSFAYEEEISFRDLGVPALLYQQRAWLPQTDEVLHVETGLWRASQDGALVVTIALPRVTEVSEGTFAYGHIELASRHVNRGSGGAGLVAVRRSYELSGGNLSYRIAMATEGVPRVTAHLEGMLTMVSES